MCEITKQQKISIWKVTKSEFMFPFMLMFPKHVSEMLQFVVTE